MAIVLPTFGWNSFAANSINSTVGEVDIEAAQRIYRQNPLPPLWAISNSKIADSPSPSSQYSQSFAATSSSPSAPWSPESTSTPTAATIQHLSVVSGKHRAGLPEELDPSYPVQCFDQVTRQLIPMHPGLSSTTMNVIAGPCGDSSSNCKPAADNAAAMMMMNGGGREVAVIKKCSGRKTLSPVTSNNAEPMTSLQSHSADAGAAGSGPAANGKGLQKSQNNKPPPIQPITLTHKYQEPKVGKNARKSSSLELPANSVRPGSSSESLSDDGSVTSSTSRAELNSTLLNSTPPVTKSLSPLQTVYNPTPFPSLPQPFPIMFHPGFTPTTPGTQLPFVYPAALPSLGINSPLTAAWQHLLAYSQPNYMMAGGAECPTFVWPTAKGGYMMPTPPGLVLQTPPFLQTPPVSAFKEMAGQQQQLNSKKRCSPQPELQTPTQQAFINGTSDHSPKKLKMDSVNLTTMTTTAFTQQPPSISPLSISNYHQGNQEGIDNDSKCADNESDSRENTDSDSEDEMVTCSQYHPSPIEGTDDLPPFPNGRGVVQLWQFLLDLLLTPDKSCMIQWTGNEYEFTILQPDEIAAMWGSRKGKPKMNYDKLSRGLRYYYSKGIMDKVPGKKLTFKFTCNVEDYVKMRSNNPNAVQTLRAIIINSKQSGKFTPSNIITV